MTVRDGGPGGEGHCPRREPYDAPMLRTALRPRFLGLLALMVAATVVCGWLASWQWDRAHRAITTQAAEPQHLGRIQDVTGVGAAVTNDVAGQVVDATGTYAPEEQVLVTDRRIDGTDAVIVVTALHVRLDDGTDARVPVARGWLPAGDVRAADGTIDRAAIPAAPTGVVTVSGLLEASEAASGGIEDGIAPQIATPMLVNAWGSPMFAGYVAVTDPADGLRPMPAASSAFSQGLNWQNVGYAAQWILFGGFFLYLWWRSVRTAHLDELAERRSALRARLGADGDAGSGGGAGGDANARAPASGGRAGAPQPSAPVGAPQPSAPVGASQSPERED